MNKSQVNHMNMQDSTLEFFDNNNSIWINKKPIANKVNVLKDANQRLHDINDAQQSNITKGHTAQKNDALASIISRCYSLASNVADWAIDTNNLVLLNEVKYSQSAIEEGSENEIEKRCKKIAFHGKTHVAALITEGYDVVEAEIDQLILDIIEEQKLVTTRDVEGGKQVNNTATILELIAQARLALTGLDRLIDGSNITDDSFIGTYKTLRFIGGWHKTKPAAAKPPVV